MAYILRLAQRHAAGALIQVNLEDDRGTTKDTQLCVHCGMHWVPRRGSGRRRGWCWRCTGATCGKQACETRCVPMERMIELLEARGRVEANIREIARSG